MQPRSAAALAAVAFAGLAHAQFATAPQAVNDAPWARAYRACAEQALMRRVAARDTAGTPPPAQQLVALAENDCAGALPVPGIGIDAPTLQLVVAAEHRDLMSHFGHTPTVVTTMPSTPPSTPVTATIAVGDGGTCPRPDYLPAAVRAGASGTSRIRLTIAPDGSVSDGQLIGASGPTREHALLDSQALASFRQCRFPADPDRPPRRTVLEYVWRLD